MNFILSTLLFLFLGNFALAQSLFKPEVGDNESQTFQSSHVLYINHASSLWDSDATTKDSLNEVLNIAKNSGKFQIFVAVHSPATTYLPAAQNYFVQSPDVDHTVLSSTGAHRISFPEAKIVVLSGGNLSMCLCEAMRDIVRNGNQDVVPTLLLVKEAIFDDSLYANKYRLSSPLESWKSFNLTEILSVMDEYSITEYFKNEIIGNDQFCPHQKMGKDGPLSTKEFNFILKDGGKVIGTFGNGTKKISIQLSTVSSFLNKVDEIDNEIGINQDKRCNNKPAGQNELAPLKTQTVTQ